MEIINEVLKIATYISMMACTGIWFYLWRVNLRGHIELHQKIREIEREINDLKRQIDVLRHQIRVVQEPLYRGDYV